MMNSQTMASLNLQWLRNKAAFAALALGIVALPNAASAQPSVNSELPRFLSVVRAQFQTTQRISIETVDITNVEKSGDLSAQTEWSARVRTWQPAPTLENPDLCLMNRVTVVRDARNSVRTEPYRNEPSVRLHHGCFASSPEGELAPNTVLRMNVPQIVRKMRATGLLLSRFSKIHLQRNAGDLFWTLHFRESLIPGLPADLACRGTGFCTENAFWFANERTGRVFRGDY